MSFYFVLSGKGTSTYNEEINYLKPNNIVFVDCKKNIPIEVVLLILGNYYGFTLMKNWLIIITVIFNFNSSSVFKNILFQSLDLTSNKNAVSEILSSNLLNTLVTQALTLEKLDIKINRNTNSEKINQIKQYIDKNLYQ